MKILQISTSVNSGSIGRIASEIGSLLISHGHESIIAYGRTSRERDSKVIKIGNKADFLTHIAYTRLFDLHGFGSKKATKKFITQIKEINPDIIHLHNIHGYYMHIGILFEYLRTAGKPIVWTFHDCWPFTGHCSYFDRFNCEKWQLECYNCQLTNGYPNSWFYDNSRNNFQRKKNHFSGIANLTLITPCNWLATHLSKSFLKQYPSRIINYGISLEKFKPFPSSLTRIKYSLEGNHIILGVANIWNRRKGLADFIKLRSLLDSNIEIVLVGLNATQINKLPCGIRGISRTESVKDLAMLYSAADVFVNPTYADNFPLVNLEALACGTPIITYDTGGSPEAISDECGFSISRGNVEGLYSAIKEVLFKGKNYFSHNCRKRAVKLYSNNERNMDYLNLYELLISKIETI